MLGQSELTILVDPRLPSKIYQGITTEITGEGESVAPLNDAIIKAREAQFRYLHIDADWRSFGQYFARLEKQGLGIRILGGLDDPEGFQMLRSGRASSRRSR